MHNAEGDEPKIIQQRSVAARGFGGIKAVSYLKARFLLHEGTGRMVTLNTSGG